MTTTAEPARDARRVPRQPRKKRHPGGMMLILAAGLLRDPRFRKGAMITVITLAGVVRLTRESQARARARLASWWDALPVPGGPAPPGGRPDSDRGERATRE